MTLFVLIISAVNSCATIYVAARSPQYIVVAMDTRMVQYGALTSNNHDNYCKIIPLGDQRFFFMAGMDDSSRAMEHYSTAANMAISDYSREQNIDIEALTARWANHFGEYYRQPLSNPTDILNGFNYVGVFGGKDNNDKVLLYKGTINRIFLREGFYLRGSTHTVSVAAFDDNTHFTTARVQYKISSQEDYSHFRRASGAQPNLNQSIVDEVLQQQTTRAKHLLDGLKATYHWRLPINDATADGAAFLVTAAANGVLQWSGDAWSGGVSISEDRSQVLP